MLLGLDGGRRFQDGALHYGRLRQAQKLGLGRRELLVCEEALLLQVGELPQFVRLHDGAVIERAATFLRRDALGVHGFQGDPAMHCGRGALCRAASLKLPYL